MSKTFLSLLVSTAARLAHTNDLPTRSGERLAIRLRDLNASYRKEFAGLDWFPVDPSFRVQAKFVPHAEEKKVEMLNILGDIEVFEAAGYVDFELQGQKVRMEPMKAREGTLWFIFRDGTSGKGSYQAARFLRTERLRTANS